MIQNCLPRRTAMENQSLAALHGPENSCRCSGNLTFWNCQPVLFGAVRNQHNHFGQATPALLSPFIQFRGTALFSSERISAEVSNRTVASVGTATSGRLPRMSVMCRSVADQMMSSHQATKPRKAKQPNIAKPHLMFLDPRSLRYLQHHPSQAAVLSRGT